MEKEGKRKTSDTRMGGEGKNRGKNWRKIKQNKDLEEEKTFCNTSY